MYQRVDLSTFAAVGVPGPIPSELVGLDDASLANIPAAIRPAPVGYAKTGFWPVMETAVQFDPRAKALTDEWDLTVQSETKTVIGSRRVRNLTSAEIAALPVPQEVTRRQAKIVMSRAGILSAADQAIAAMPGQAGEEARIDWSDASVFRRDNPLIAGLGETLGLSAAQIDALFVQAATIF